jgi:hypothetical protein
MDQRSPVQHIGDRQPATVAAAKAGFSTATV